MPQPDVKQLVQELQVHQIELEMQNEELRRTRLALEESRDRYLDLYDYAPVGYFTLTREGRIVEVNLTGATLLGVPRDSLIGRGLGSFVASEARDRWERHLAGVRQSASPSEGPGETQPCELKLERENGSVLHAWLESAWLERPEKHESAGGSRSRIITWRCRGTSWPSSRSAKPTSSSAAASSSRRCRRCMSWGRVLA